ncbi:unannotated protein [freshwater metagenome]|uniref:Unannotated protein n=1 Tax=freshwater metagenome TaxID=449393 RepID=A0A6J7E4X9_9ZZZZ
MPSCSLGPATPVSARPTSLPSTRRAPIAIATAVASFTTGPSGTPSRLNLTALAYDTIEPRSTSLAPAIPVIRAPTRPPVTDSARPSVRPRERMRSSTTDSIVSASWPNTWLDNSARIAASCGSMSASADARSAARAVRRTLMPSQPLARNASVGLPASSSRSMIPSRRSLSPLSLSPHVRSVRDTMMLGSPERRRRSGRTARSSMSFISCGTPGTR